jgi:predicted amidohydrolase YtcJ
MIFLNGNFYTVDERLPRAEAILVENGRIVFVGSNSAVMKFRKGNTETVDLRGATVVPGMTDSHYHLIGVGEREMTLNLEGTSSLTDFLVRVQHHAEQALRGSWVTGRGWNEALWNQPLLPSRSDLDLIVPNNPVFLTRIDTHCAVANSMALRIAGIDSTTSSPFGGQIMRDHYTGEPTGILLDAAQELVTHHVPPLSESQMEKAILLAVKRSLELGWCQIQNAGSQLPEVNLIRKLYEEDLIKLRIYNALYGPGSEADALLERGPLINAYDHRFTMRTIKILLDGSLGSRSAALLEPYSDAGTSGFLTIREADLLPLLKEALRCGIQIETHAIGDRANRWILDLYEEAFRAISTQKRKILMPRWRIEHAQILAATDIPRFARLGVIPSMQPSHAISDHPFAESRLGARRLSGAYAWPRLIRSGAIVAGGSDAPVERGEPMIEFHAAFTRVHSDECSSESGSIEQQISRDEALKMFTLWPAIASFEEGDKGSIEAGKLADLTVLSADIMRIPAGEILDTFCLMTVVGGDIVYRADGFA